MWLAAIKSFKKYRFLLFELVNRELKLKYRRSILGYAWSLLNPLFMMLVVTAVFSQIFRYQIENFPVYLITGQVIFNFFSEATNGAMSSIIGSTALIKKVYTPKYIFPLSKVCFSVINMLFSMIAVIIVMIFTKVPVSWTVLLGIIPIAYASLLSLGLGLILSVIAVYFRDMIYLYGIFITALMYFTPIFYPVDMLSPEMMNLIQFNPLYHIITYFRKVMLYQTIPSLGDNVICFSFGALFLAIGLILFKHKQREFILFI